MRPAPEGFDAGPVVAAPAGFSAKAGGIVQQAESARAPIPVLGADAGGLLADQAQLQQWAEGTDLALAPGQWATLAAVTAHLQAVRHAYEATQARVVAVEPGKFRLEIPAYPAAGDALRERFHAELAEKLGAHAAAEIAEKLGGALEGYFAGFGVSVQILDFSGDAAHYAVTRTVRYWHAAEATGRLTTRRETHFPGLEDPAGHTWGPFLALVAQRIAGRG